ncbi:aminotransferase class I/II-fold pyridoxal phosphate-dependent enzyme [Nonomuraea monospora]|uniref:aminotransferase class I/II-fold pyridoxal phosphate-dependent enzyme n=1 Tax=Nonomuraea monospora TaxID=568818 RepID=UPI0031D70A15
MTDQPGTVDLTGRTPPWPRPAAELWRACLTRSLAGEEPWEVPPRAGHPELRAALGEHLDLDPDALAITSGVRASLPYLMSGSTRLILERPTFLELGVVARGAGHRVTLAELDAVLAGRAADDTAVLWLTHPARNPDGRSLGAAELDRLLTLVPAYRRIVVNRTYQWYRPAALPAAFIQVGTLHKLTGGGMRVGWIWPVPASYHGLPADGGPPGPWQLALAAFIRAGGLRLLSGNPIDEQARRRHFEGLLGRPGTGSGSGIGSSERDLYCGAQLLLPVTGSEPDVVRALAANGVRVSPGRAFAAPGHVRLSWAGRTDGQLAVAATRINEVLAAHTRRTG